MEKISLKEIAYRLRNDRKLLVIAFVMIVGIILTVISSFGSESEEKEQISLQTDKIFNESEYTGQLENKLEEMISLISGAGETKVIVTLECDYETVYAKDGSIEKDNDSTDEDSEYIIIDSRDVQGGLVLKTVTPKIRGVAVVCAGGDSMYVKTAVTDLLSAVLDIGTNHISVSKLR